MKNKRINIVDLYSKYGIFFILILAIAVSTILKPEFLAANNLINILRQNTVIAIIAFGSMMVLISAEVDLSPGSIAAFSGCLAASVVKNTQSVFLAVLIGLAVGAILGFINGVIITKARIPSFIMTLAMMMAMRGLTFIVTNARPITSLGNNYAFLGQGYIGPIPVPIIILLIVFFISALMLNRLRFGRYVYAVGGNANAAKASGINVDSIKIKVFMYSGLLAALGGIILMSRLNSGQPTSADAYEFDAITAAIIGGTSMSGGVGKPYGTLAGALFVGVLINIMTITNVNSYYQQVARGVIIALAVIIDTFIRRGKSK